MVSNLSLMESRCCRANYIFFKNILQVLNNINIHGLENVHENSLDWIKVKDTTCLEVYKQPKFLSKSVEKVEKISYLSQKAWTAGISPVKKLRLWKKKDKREVHCASSI